MTGVDTVSPEAEPIPTPSDVLLAFNAAGVRACIFRDKLEVALRREHDWDKVYDAFELMDRLPGKQDEFQRYLSDI